MWTARSGVDTSSVEAALSAARDAGVANLNSIAEQRAASVGLSPEACLTYLRDNLHFYYGEAERDGLALFAQMAARLTDGSPSTDLSHLSLQAHGCENS
jgi:chorismate dehydratase